MRCRDCDAEAIVVLNDEDLCIDHFNERLEKIGQVIRRYRNGAEPS